jgi:hypothetical protein
MKSTAATTGKRGRERQVKGQRGGRPFGAVSLRTVARRARIDPGHLSRVVSGEKGLSEARARDLARALRISLAELRVRLGLVERGTVLQRPA